MKKILNLFLLFILLIPTVVLGKDTCNPQDIIIKNISVSNTNGFVEETQSSIDNNKINLDLKMYKVGDTIEYNIQVENTSDEDYYFNDKSIKKNTEYLEYSLVNNEEIIPAKTTKTVQLRVTYKNQIPESSYEDTNKIEINISDKPIENPETFARYNIFIVLIVLTIISVVIKVKGKDSSKKQLLLMLILLTVVPLIPFSVYAVCSVKLEIESKVVITNKEATFLPGEQVNIKMKQLAGTSASSSATVDQNITAIKYSENEPTDVNKEEKNTVSIPESDYPIYMWFDNGTIYWWSEDAYPNMNENSSLMFRAIYNLSDINDFNRFDPSNTTTLMALFYDSPSISNLSGLANWNTSKVESL